jgi:hypothetical protein
MSPDDNKMGFLIMTFLNLFLSLNKLVSHYFIDNDMQQTLISSFICFRLLDCGRGSMMNISLHRFDVLPIARMRTEEDVFC